MTDPDASRAGQSLQMTGIPSGFDTAALDLLTTPGVTKGSTYTISFKARLASPSPTAWPTSPSTPIPVMPTQWVGNETPVNSTAWTTITGTYTLPAGATEARMYVEPHQREPRSPLNMLIDDVTILGTSTTAVDSHFSTYGGSSLPRMYGGLGPVGIRTVTDGGTVSFSVSCAGTLVEYDAGGKVVGTPRTVDIGGLVFADAESSRTGEYVTATPQGSFGSSPWRQIDQFDGSCTNRDDVRTGHAHQLHLGAPAGQPQPPVQYRYAQRRDAGERRQRA